jgi:surfeit locus 1 family protein
MPDSGTSVNHLLTGRALGLLAVAVVLVAVMVGLGLWQYQAYDQHQRDDARSAADQAPVPLDEALGPDEAFHADSVARPVTATGEYVQTEQIYVTDYDGASNRYAVVTPLVTASGSAILVVRGSTDDLGTKAPEGPVDVEGSLQPSMEEGAPIDGDRVTDGIRTSSLVGAVGEDLYSGYLVLTSSTPEDSLTPVEPPLPDPSRWAGIRNLIYALQWWLFAAFVVFMWWRIAHDTADETPTEVG